MRETEKGRESKKERARESVVVLLFWFNIFESNKGTSDLNPSSLRTDITE